MVLFRFPDPADAGTCAELVRGLVGRVPQIRRLRAGVNTVASARAFDVALVVELDSADDLAGYADHPDHRSVAEWIAARAGAVASVDFADGA